MSTGTTLVPVSTAVGARVSRVASPRCLARRDGGPYAASMVRAALTFAALALAGRALADEPPALLRGRVLEKGTRRPLPGVLVTADGGATAETDASGAFALAVPAAARSIALQLPGFVALVTPVGSVNDEAVFRLAPAEEGAGFETVVRAPAADGPPPVTVSGDEARSAPGALGDPFRSVAALPGVAQIAWPAAVWAVRGANPGNTGFLLDGLRVPALFHFALGPSIVHPFLLEAVDFYPGGAPARDGRFVGGVVSARSAPAPDDRLHLAGDARLYDAGALAAGPWGAGGGVAAAARYSYTGALFSLLSTDTTLQYADYQVRVDHPLGGGRATLLALGSIDDLGSKTGATHEAALQFHRVDLRWDRAAGGGRLRVATAVGVDRGRSELFDAPVRSRALTASPRASYERAIGPVTIDVGADAEAQRFAIETDPFQGQLGDLASARDALAAGAYLAATLRLGPLTISPAVRADQFVEQGAARFEPQPRLSLAVAATDTLALHGELGRYAQMPSLPVGVPGFESFGLADLGTQTSWQAAVGATLTRAAAAFGATAFYQRLRVSDVRDLDLHEANPLRGNFLVMRPGRSYGVELLLRRPESARLHGWIAYTLSWSRRVVDGVEGPSDWDQRHIANATLVYRLRHGYRVGAGAHYHTGRVVPVLGGPGATVERQRLPPFFSLSLRAERRLRFDRFLLDVYAEVANATLEREVLQLDRPAPRYDQVVEESYRLVLPSVGVHGEW